MRNLGNSNIYQNSSKFVGIGTTTPASALDVNGAEYVRGQLFLPASGTATPTQGFNSRVQNFTASSYNSNTHSAENHSLQWVAEPLGNNTPSPSATLHLRFYSTGTALETGYSIGSNGIVTFAPGQTFPGTGTITGVTAGTDLTGGGTSGKVTLNLDTTKVPQLNVPNTFTAAQTITAKLDVLTADITGVKSTSTNNGETVSGVQGIVTNIYGAGVQGTSASPSTLGTTVLPAAGVWGDTGQDANVGVLGTADDGQGLAGWNNSSANYAVAAVNTTTSPTAGVFLTRGEMVGGQCVIDTSGNLMCTGSKSAVVSVDSGRKVALYAVESPENWFEDFGSGQLSSGTVHVALEPSFSNTINATEYHVFITPRGDSEGLYVTNATPSGFDVRESRGGRSNIAFDYRIVAHRKGYENVRLADMTEHFQAPLSKVRNSPLRFKPPVGGSTKISRMPRTGKGRIQSR
jgi:hypothetical protein